MFVIQHGSPPPFCDLLDGVVNGVNAVFDLLGYGTEVRCELGPAGPAIPCDSSSATRPSVTRQINRPSAGRSRSKFFFVRFSSSKYSVPSARSSTLKHSFFEPLTGDSTSFCFVRGSITAGVSHPSRTLHHAETCRGLPSCPW